MMDYGRARCREVQCRLVRGLLLGRRLVQSRLVRGLMLVRRPAQVRLARASLLVLFGLRDAAVRVGVVHGSAGERSVAPVQPGAMRAGAMRADAM